jgi:hypothetical protein
MRSTADISERDFRRVGVTWRVRKGMGVTYTFHDLASLIRHIEQGRVEGRDVLSYDARTWVPLDTIDDLSSYFEDIWRKAERGEILAPRPDATPMGVPAPSGNDEEEEGPTTIMGHGHALMDDIRKAVAEATTPPPTQPRLSEPRRTPSKSPAPEPPPRPREPPQDDPTTFSRRAPATSSDLTPSTSDVRAHSPNPPGRAAPPAPSAGQPREGSASENLLVVGISVVAIVVIVVAAWLLIGGQMQVGAPTVPPPGPVVAPPAVPVLPKPGLVAPPAAPPAGAPTPTPSPANDPASPAAPPSGGAGP